LLLRFLHVAIAANAALARAAAVEGAIPPGALPQPLLLLLQAVQQVDDDVANARQEVVEAGLRGFLAERLFENPTKQFRNVSEIGRVYADGVESPRRDVELIAQAHIDIGDLTLGGVLARPQCQRFCAESAGAAVFRARLTDRGAASWRPAGG
jgi:hypothetical protein